MSKRLVTLGVQYTNRNGSICYKGETISLEPGEARRLVTLKLASYADGGPHDVGVTSAMEGKVTKPATVELRKRTGLERLAYLRGRIKAYGVKVTGRSGDAMQIQLTRLIAERGVIE